MLPSLALTALLLIQATPAEQELLRDLFTTKPKPPVAMCDIGKDVRAFIGRRDFRVQGTFRVGRVAELESPGCDDFILPVYFDPRYRPSSDPASLKVLDELTRDGLPRPTPHNAGVIEIRDKLLEVVFLASLIRDPLSREDARYALLVWRVDSARVPEDEKK